MQEFAVIPFTRYQDDGLALSLGRIWHSETLKPGYLVIRTIAELHYPADRPANPLLRRGRRLHRRSGKHYEFHRLAYWIDTNEVGMWYSALYNPDELIGPKHGLGPFWFRPLHTPDCCGILDRRPDGSFPFIIT